MPYKSPLALADSLTSPFDTSRTSRKGSHDFEPDFNKHRLVHLTADEYYKLVGNEAGVSWKDLQDQRAAVKNDLSVDDMVTKMKNGDKFPTPWIHLNYKEGAIPHFQEGLHRMLAAKRVYGDDAKFPVYLGYEGDDDWKDIESGDIDSFIKRMNDKRHANQIKYDAEEKAKAEAERQEEIKDARLWFHLNGQDDVTDEQLERYRKEMDDLFKDDSDF